MENLDISEEKRTHVSPKTTLKKRRRLSVLTSRKHFRKSMKHDRVEYTIPNKSISIIEISSTDSESSKSAESLADIDESEVQSPKSLNSNDASDSEGIISPSPNKNSKNLKCLSTGKKKPNNIKLYRHDTGAQGVENEKMAKNVCSNKENPIRDANAFLEMTILDYDKFQKPTSLSNALMNSTMIQPEEIQTNQLETDIQDKSNSNTSFESVNKSCENLLDDLYGDSWRPYREKILPPSERKPPTKKIIVERRIPATEKKVKKSEIYKNPYVENEKYKSNNLLKALHTKRIREAIETPLIKSLKALCDEESSEHSDVVPSPRKPRIRLKFDENQKSQEEDESEDSKEKVDPKLKNDNDFCWSDKENSLDKLPLKDRIERKKLSKKKIGNNLEKDHADVVNKNPNCHTQGSSDKNKLHAKANTNGGESKKKTSSSDENTDNMLSGKTSSSGFSSESNNKAKKKNTQNVNKKDTKSRKKRLNYLETSSSSHDSINNSGGNIGGKNKKKVVNTKHLEKYLDSSDSCGESEINKKVPTPRIDHPKLEDTSSPDENLENIVKKITKKVSKTKITTNASEDSNEVPNHEKGAGKNVRKKALRTRTNNRKYYSENSSDSDDSPVECNKKLGLKKADENKTYSFLASLSSTVPNHQCDPTAKVFKANFKNNKESLAKKLFELYNKNVFNNLIPESVPLEWNARMLCTAGYCYSKRITHRDGRVDMEARIVLSAKVLTTPERLRDTLIHEMCHAATWLVDKVRDGHGKHWKAWASKAKKEYPELPPIKTCHNYELSSKYVYKCSGCGYEVKRHRKSLDIERKRCGYCCGKFQLFINKVNKKGEQKMVPFVDTPKKEPKGFAAFYKENYANYKTPTTTPAEVMKMLSSKFKEMKV